MFLRDIISRLGGEILGEVEIPLTGVGTIEGATSSQITARFSRLMRHLRRGVESRCPK